MSVSKAAFGKLPEHVVGAMDTDEKINLLGSAKYRYDSAEREITRQYEAAMDAIRERSERSRRGVMTDVSKAGGYRGLLTERYSFSRASGVSGVENENEPQNCTSRQGAADMADDDPDGLVADGFDTEAEALEWPDKSEGQRKDLGEAAEKQKASGTTPPTKKEAQANPA